MALSTNEKTPPGAQRIMALWFPHLPAERIMRQRLGRLWRSRVTKVTPPLVFSRHENNTQYVAALDAQAEALGLRTHIGIAEARAMHPSIEVVEADPQADARLLESLADWCDRYTPLVAIEGLEGLFLDVTGCVHLFGGDQAMLDNVLGFLSHQGFDVRAALASTPGAAWAAARYRNGTVIPRGDEAEFIAPLPLAALRLDPDTRTSLQSVGLRVAGALMNTARAPLVRRFGRIVTLRLDQALGHIEEPISPRLPIPALIAERNFADPIGLMDHIEALIPMLARQLKEELEKRNQGAKRLQLQLFRADGVVTRLEFGTSRPLRDAGLILKLFRERLGASASNIDAGFGFDLIRLCVMACAPLAGTQLDLEDGNADRSGDIALFTDRVRARLGDHAIHRPLLLESHWPERTVMPSPSSAPHAPSPDEAHVDALWRNGSKERPIRLLDPPEWIDVTLAEVPEGPPGRFRWRHASYRVASAEGPERIAPEWWRESLPAVEKKEQEEDEDYERRRKQAIVEKTVHLTRDYFRIEDSDGRRYWLYRQGLYGMSKEPPRWYMQGLFA